MLSSAARGVFPQKELSAGWGMGKGQEIFFFFFFFKPAALRFCPSLFGISL